MRRDAADPRRGHHDRNVTFAANGSGAEGADLGIVVIGETPYAEMQGDRTDLSLAKEDLAVVAAMKKAGIPVVVVLLSGRPLLVEEVLLDEELELSDDPMGGSVELLLLLLLDELEELDEGMDRTS